MTLSIGELIDADDLDGAVEALNAEVRRQPTNSALRVQLAEVLAVAGNLERADKLLDAVAHQDPSVAITTALFRQLIRAEEARQQFYAEGRLPDFVHAPSELDQLYLKAIVALREGDFAGAAALTEEAEAARPPQTGSADGVAFEDFRDLDDIAASHLDVLTSTGKFFWIPLRKVISVDLHKPERLRDLLWRRATLSIEEGPDGEVFLPTVYPFGSELPAAPLRLGHETDFAEQGGGGPIRGSGLRTFLVDDDAKTALEIDRLEFATERSE